MGRLYAQLKSECFKEAYVTLLFPNDVPTDMQISCIHILKCDLRLLSVRSFDTDPACLFYLINMQLTVSY